MKLFDMITNFHNWLSDKDFIWWPFSFLRPEQNVPMTFNHTLQMTGCFGGLSFVMFTIMAIMNNAFTLETTFMTFLGCFGGFLIWFNLITKPLWNRRAFAHNKK